MRLESSSWLTSKSRGRRDGLLGPAKTLISLLEQREIDQGPLSVRAMWMIPFQHTRGFLTQVALSLAQALGIPVKIVEKSFSKVRSRGKRVGGEFEVD